MGSAHLGMTPDTGRITKDFLSSMCAKSKSGGTRTYIRGRVGSDVYSVGRDAKGKKQQVVRSLAESVANPQTQAQMRGRMIMSTIAQALAALRPIVDHSFDNVAGARANLAEFTARNYALIKADIAAHPSSDNAFGLNMYQEKGAKQGAYVIAAGQAQIPQALVLTKATGVIAIQLPADNLTIAGLKANLGMTNEEYFTLVGLKSTGEVVYDRFRVSPDMADDTPITGANVKNVFAQEGNVMVEPTLNGTAINITFSSIGGCCAVIVSMKYNGKFIHNDAQLGDGASFVSPADVALPTYPVGAQNYLNGGDIFGQSESLEPGGVIPPTPEPSILTAAKGGVAIARGGTCEVPIDSASTISGTLKDISELSQPKVAIATLSGSVATVVKELTISSDSFTGTWTPSGSTQANAAKLVLLDGTTLIDTYCSFSNND